MTNAGVTMSIKHITFLSFCWYFLVGAEIIPLAITPVRDAAPNGMLTGKPMNLANVATLDIPVATLNYSTRTSISPHRSIQYLSVLLVFLLSHFLLIYQPLSLSLDHGQMESVEAPSPSGDPGPQVELVDIYYSSSFLINE